MHPPLTYAVGDIHGRRDLLDAALTAIDADAGEAPSRLIFLGDYIDRGPQSRQVIERLMELTDAGRAVCLKGNHEDLMVTALTEARSSGMRRWLANGGDATLASYGVGPDDDLLGAVPREHLRWLSGLPLTTGDDHRIYVHAGLLPKTPFHRQSETTCVWVRERFLRARPQDFDCHVVHGHTPLWEGKPDPTEPELLAHRTNLDTAAFATGRLSIGVFEPARPGGPVRVIPVQGAPATFERKVILDPQHA